MLSTAGAQVHFMSSLLKAATTLVALATCVWLLGMGGEASKQHQLSILALGDSLTEGFASAHRAAFLILFSLVSWSEDKVPYAEFLGDLLAPHLAQGWSAEISNQGVSGEVTSEIMARAPYKSKWDVAVILGGTNDLGNSEASAIWENLHNMYTKFEAMQVTVVAVTIPNIRMVREPRSYSRQ